MQSISERRLLDRFDAQVCAGVPSNSHCMSVVHFDMAAQAAQAAG